MDDLSGWTLSSRVRSYGWHCIWRSGTLSGLSLGRTVEGATSKAVRATLAAVSAQFNAAEIDEVRVSNYGLFSVARVAIHARQIQLDSSLSSPKGREEERHDSFEVAS